MVMASKKAKTMFQKAERKRALILAMREHPDWSHTDLARHLGCERGTIARDLDEITQDLQKMNSESFQVHHQRLLMEIAANKAMCLEMLNDAKSKKLGSGSRWMEEYTRLVQLEIKLLGMDKYDPMLGASDKKPIDKKHRDAVVDAAMKAFEMGKNATIDMAKMLVNHSPQASQPPAAEEDEMVPINREAI